MPKTITKVRKTVMSNENIGSKIIEQNKKALETLKKKKANAAKRTVYFAIAALAITLICILAS